MKSTFAGLDLPDGEFAVGVADALARVEDLLLTELSSGDDILTEAATHLAKAGGKRFRPMFAVLASHFGPDPAGEKVITAATVVEMIHLATLYHDDVMDEADMRRGVESANARWSNSVAILAGDFLFARASRLVSTLGPESVRIIAETFAELVTGQMRETVGARGTDDVEHYLRVVWEKTGSLIAAAGRFGAMTSGADPERTATLTKFGDIVGVAFQVSDDIIDIASVTGESGKTPGTDLREGVHTLPVLYALAGDDADSARLRELLLDEGTGEPRPLTEDAEVDEALNLLVDSAGMAQARRRLAQMAQDAHAELATLPDGPAREAFSALVDYTVERVG
ncbi:putative polyprenyl diphosphate synthase [Gordonia hirsuta DSM 44140 = NBRC 16056]|uniref:Putative polyprenyl diphosphate synthase n=1 Tax=Gordonia hirsuta DSM 44140 = NBRC 16056 TaxID=1121927 RepID=L7L620_9ACTN|nr:polyprenyl synthetase family protein [Gordonia hirsuta]GAC56585.1 putative polyprenyl diphosphate synthase [Gordonia hirsuta DSM 44140 = NBRC 16056]